MVIRYSRAYWRENDFVIEVEGKRVNILDMNEQEFRRFIVWRLGLASRVDVMQGAKDALAGLSPKDFKVVMQESFQGGIPSSEKVRKAMARLNAYERMLVINEAVWSRKSG
jgi:hypothetical protein